MTRKKLAIGAIVLLAACGQKPQPSENQATANEKITTEEKAGGNAAGNNVAEANASSNGTRAVESGLPPSNAGLRFVGRWAKSQAECTTKPWIFTEKEIAAVDGPHCTIYHIATAPGGYDLAATCPAKVPVHTDLISIRFAESAQAILVESNAISPMGLVYCGK
jgi:hypothetical protein